MVLVAAYSAMFIVELTTRDEVSMRPVSRDEILIGRSSRALITCDPDMVMHSTFLVAAS